MSNYSGQWRLWEFAHATVGISALGVLTPIVDKLCSLWDHGRGQAIAPDVSAGWAFHQERIQ
jgi:hypothetical protein